MQPLAACSHTIHDFAPHSLHQAHEQPDIQYGISALENNLRLLHGGLSRVQERGARYHVADELRISALAFLQRWADTHSRIGIVRRFMLLLLQLHLLGAGQGFEQAGFRLKCCIKNVCGQARGGCERTMTRETKREQRGLHLIAAVYVTLLKQRVPAAAAWRPVRAATQRLRLSTTR